LLFWVLGEAALGGLLVMLITMPIGLKIGSEMQSIQEGMLRHKDSRMSTINEILNGIRIIKLFSWEDSVLDKISRSRTAELQSLYTYKIMGAMVEALWRIVPVLVGVAAFLTHTKILGRELTAATGFTALTLFNLLQVSISYT